MTEDRRRKSELCKTCSALPQVKTPKQPESELERNRNLLSTNRVLTRSYSISSSATLYTHLSQPFHAFKNQSPPRSPRQGPLGIRRRSAQAVRPLGEGGGMQPRDRRPHALPPPRRRPRRDGHRGEHCAPPRPRLPHERRLHGGDVAPQPQGASQVRVYVMRSF